MTVMLSFNGIVLNDTVVMYDKSNSKVKIVQEIADELPVPTVSIPVKTSWMPLSKGVFNNWYTEGEPDPVPLRYKAEGQQVCP